MRRRKWTERDDARSWGVIWRTKRNEKKIGQREQKKQNRKKQTSPPRPEKSPSGVRFIVLDP